MGNYVNHNIIDTSAGRRRAMNLSLGRHPDDMTPVDWHFKKMSQAEQEELRGGVTYSFSL